MSINKDFLFESAKHDFFSIYIHIVDHFMIDIFVHNDSDHTIVLFKRNKLRKIIGYETAKCYSVDIDIQNLTQRFGKNFKKL